MSSRRGLPGGRAPVKGVPGTHRRGLRGFAFLMCSILSYSPASGVTHWRKTATDWHLYRVVQFRFQGESSPSLRDVTKPGSGRTKPWSVTLPSRAWRGLRRALDRIGPGSDCGRQRMFFARPDTARAISRALVSPWSGGRLFSQLHLLARLSLDICVNMSVGRPISRRFHTGPGDVAAISIFARRGSCAGARYGMVSRRHRRRRHRQRLRLSNRCATTHRVGWSKDTRSGTAVYQGARCRSPRSPFARQSHLSCRRDALRV